MESESSICRFLPSWWHEDGSAVWGAGDCVYHNTYCRRVEEDIRLLGGTQLKEEDDDDSTDVCEEERIPKMGEYLNLMKELGSAPIVEWKIQDKYDDFLHLLTSSSRDYLIRSNKEKVYIYIT